MTHVPTDHTCECGAPLHRILPSNMMVCLNSECAADPKYLVPTLTGDDTHTPREPHTPLTGDDNSPAPTSSPTMTT